MAGVASGGSGDSRPYDGIASEQEGGATGEMLTEWRSSDQLENGTPSTSPPFWDTDDDDEDCGLRPSELYGKHTWKIDKFSQINKRELRSNAFEVGGYKWYILIYPQGCDVCNHLSLFLCVANHDKLLPGWSHFAQFTIAVVNKDPKKSKYSDTLHRFWKKEHDWGWKKFMELSKVMDGFIDADTLIIKAQVQVIREKADRPFRCLDCQYRRELVRVYLTNVEQICRRFVEEKRSKLVKLMEDKARWSSFCAFWLAIDPNSRGDMTRERTDTILRAVVKQFFIEKEVTSTLVMDSLYSGLRALECQTNTRKGRCKLIGTEESISSPVVFVNQDMFALIDDVLLLLERASLEPLPPKDDKGPQNRMKDGGPGDDFSKESIERDERRLTELGRRTIEIFVLAHIFNKIDGAYQEAVALKRQEELIREEAAWLESEQKSKRGAADKEKKSKKKQGKQKRNNRKGKDKGRDDNTITNTLDKLQLEGPDESKDSMAEESKAEVENPEAFEDGSDMSDTVDPISEVPHPDSEERESSPFNWETDTSEALISEASGGGAGPLSIVQKGIKENNSSCIVVDDTSSTCSTDSVPSVMTNGYKANYPLLNQESYRSPIRERHQRVRANSDMSGWNNEGNNVRASDARRDAVPQNGSSRSAASESLPNKIKKVEQVAKKVVSQSHPAEPSIKDQAYTHKSPEKPTVAPSSPIKSSKESPIQPKIEQKTSAPTGKSSIKKPLSSSAQPAPPVTNLADMAAFYRSSPQKSVSLTGPTEKASTLELPVMSRPLSAPIVPEPKPSTPVVSMVQTQPFLSRSVSAVGRLNTNPTPVTHHHQSYRNAMMGSNNNILTPPTSTSAGYTQTQSPNIGLNPLQPYSAPPSSIYPPMFHLQSSEFGTVNPPPMQNDLNALDLFKQGHIRSHGSFPIESPACTSGQPSHNLVTDEFPHLGIINDLLDDESGSGNIAIGTSTSFQNFNSGPQYLNRQFSYPGDNGMTNDMIVGPSSRFGRARSYQENGFQSSYDSSLSGSFESMCDFFPQINLGRFPNGQIEGLVPNQWQMADSDLAYLSTRTTDANRYPYHIPDYSNLSGHANGYSVFRPSHGQ